MTQPKASQSARQALHPPPLPRVLLVQSDSSPVKSQLYRTLEHNGFEVTATETVRDALSCLAGQDFAALICDLHLPSAGDGFTLVNAIRHLHPQAITIVMSDYPALRESLIDLLPQADEVLVTPIPLNEVVSLLKGRLVNPRHRASKVREPVATILERHALSTIDHNVHAYIDYARLGKSAW